MAKLTNRTIWCDHGWFPHHYGFCPSEEAWQRTIKAIKLNQTPYPAHDAACNLFQNRETKLPCVLVTMNHRPRTPQVVVELLSHEAMHIWRDIRKTTGERKPSSEFEAYAMQNILRNLMDAYQKTRGPLFLKTTRLRP